MSEKAFTTQHRRAHKNHLARNPVQAPQPWRQNKSTDVVTFNQGAEQRFFEWLSDKITASPTGSVTVAWVIANAAWELDVSIPTVKRYIMKWTADLAPFKSDGKEITVRMPPAVRAEASRSRNSASQKEQHDDTAAD